MDSSNAPRQYRTPPIVEAVAELQFGVAIPEGRRKKIKDWLSKKYASSIVDQQAEVKVDFSNRTTHFIDVGSVFKLASADQTDACIIGPTSIAWAKRAPYEGWNTFRSRIEDELPAALKALDGALPSRLGLRYVNRIDVPLSGTLIQYENYLKFRIICDSLLEPTNGYQWMLQKEFPDKNLKATVQSASVLPEIIGFGAISFDIDVYSDSNVPNKSTGILHLLEEMRILKNLIFEAAITDKARELYST